MHSGKQTTSGSVEDEYLFGWDATPGIVSVWANRDGLAIVWRRGLDGEQVTRSYERFYPWILSTSLDDLSHLGSALQPQSAPGSTRATARYRELDGPPGSYRYLISAQNGRILERALTYGAARRLGRPVKFLSELEDGYYRVGPVEQYLMSSGRVYFRDLDYQNIHRLQFDLETTALDPHRGRIFMVAIRDSRGLSTILEAATPEEEKNLIISLCELICQRDPDVLENHNLFGFDLPFLEQRATLLGVQLSMGRVMQNGKAALLERFQETLAIGPEARRRTRYSLAGRELIDTLDAVRRHDFVVRDMPGYGLKEVARYFKIASPDRVYIEGSEIFETYHQTPELVRHYALDDVQEVDGISRRLLGAPFALASMAPRRYERLASAGPAMGILEPLLVRAYLRRGAALPCQSAEDGVYGMHEGGAVHLFASGIAEHVVKADVASLYPSLMRTFQIGPSCDRLGVLLSILSRLTDLRLAHKAAARTEPPGSAEANHHDATQAAMKILINAAYGYMGAGSMALFADARAADEVTRRGRETLTKVLDALRERGMALIEADTDGVYFAVPADWDEERERALVDEIGTLLPQGIRLEYEGRYRAMFSHEVKNYALLTYEDRLIVHGVALRSSRAEPFGERFLRQALLCTMTGDVPAMHHSFIDMARTLRQRGLPASDLATRVRLSKTPEAYRATRTTEPAYEALIKAGRTNWYPGERVRFYRSTSKHYVWLPEETEETATNNDWQPPIVPTTPGELPERTSHTTSTRIQTAREIAERRDYDVEHYLQVLINSYAGRLRKAFAPGDFEQLFRLNQPGLFDQPIETIQPRWIRCSSNS